MLTIGSGDGSGAHRTRADSLSLLRNVVLVGETTVYEDPTSYLL